MENRIPDSSSLSWTLRADSATVPSDQILNFRKYVKTLEMLDSLTLIFTNLAEEFPTKHFVIVIIGKNLKIRMGDDRGVSIVDDFDLSREDDELMSKIVTSIVPSTYTGQGSFTLRDGGAPYAVHVHLKDVWRLRIGPLDLVNPDVGVIPLAIVDLKSMIARGDTSF